MKQSATHHKNNYSIFKQIQHHTIDCKMTLKHCCPTTKRAMSLLKLSRCDRDNSLHNEYTTSPGLYLELFFFQLFVLPFWEYRLHKAKIFNMSKGSGTHFTFNTLPKKNKKMLQYIQVSVHIFRVSYTKFKKLKHLLLLFMILKTIF